MSESALPTRLPLPLVNYRPLSFNCACSFVEEGMTLAGHPAFDAEDAPRVSLKRRCVCVVLRSHATVGDPLQAAEAEVEGLEVGMEEATRTIDHFCISFLNEASFTLASCEVEGQANLAVEPRSFAPKSQYSRTVSVSTVSHQYSSTPGSSPEAQSMNCRESRVLSSHGHFS